MTDKSDLILSTSATPHVLLVTLNRASKRNALSKDLIAELGAALRHAAVDEDVRCVVLCGSDAFLSAGADIGEMREGGFEAIDNSARRSAWRDNRNVPKPLIAAVEGIASAAATNALLADIVVAGEGAAFAQPEISIGILPGDGATQRLTRVAGKSLAMLMILSDQSISAREVMQAGLVAEVVESDRHRPERSKPRSWW
ncbi:enoyl-CoA hydratase-related protein [Bradyrhizobium sp. CIAT3101]|uniref:enoyl-CoA hydratase-related protein n=1 Tax=Bradyrhizobium sp. CIAT3101 TaxID=439387 RepID=UPI0024B23D05|nr:enoyl-CoA hydratase-related protein [Bradyrhizobium sp. CIAT3101]WFU80585.1 enoyl-CoA hydratase-related protein [Bradyrhizobium sp. CIAT3101]